MDLNKENYKNKEASLHSDKVNAPRRHIVFSMHAHTEKKNIKIQLEERQGEINPQP